jgi:hypothetical protein
MLLQQMFEALLVVSGGHRRGGFPKVPSMIRTGAEKITAHRGQLERAPARHDRSD